MTVVSAFYEISLPISGERQMMRRAGDYSNSKLCTIISNVLIVRAYESGAAEHVII